MTKFKDSYPEVYSTVKVTKDNVHFTHGYLVYDDKTERKVFIDVKSPLEAIEINGEWEWERVS